MSNVSIQKQRHRLLDSEEQKDDRFGRGQIETTIQNVPG
jgi:hypothetical protein